MKMGLREVALAQVADIRSKAQAMQDGVWGLTVDTDIPRKQKARMADVLSSMLDYCDDLEGRIDSTWPAP